MTEDNLAFYERRAREEAKAAEDCEEEDSASLHRFMAVQYETYARDLRDEFERANHMHRPEDGDTIP